MKRNKKKLLIVSIAVVVLIIILSLIFISSNFKDSNSFSLEENKWIDSNKYNVIDVALMSDIPILSYEGEGIVYNYLNYVTERESLKFNIIPYKIDDEVDYEYKMEIVDKPSNNDIVLLKDDLVLIMADNKSYSSIDSISNLKLGVISGDKELISKYFEGHNIEIIEYNNYQELKQSIVESSENNNCDGIIIPKTLYTKELIADDKNISFHISDLNKYFVLSTNGSKELNSILNKLYNKWEVNNYKQSYNSNLLSNYYKFKDISDMEKKTLQSKSYVYGFIDYGIYNSLENGKISGLNELVLKDFNKFSGLSITYTRYNNLSKLLKAFKANKVDFMLDIADSDSYGENVYKTVGVFSKNLVIVSGISNKDTIYGINSLKDKEILIVKDSFLENMLISNNIKVKSYSNIKDLMKDFSVNSISILDLENYNYYKSSALKDAKINYLFDEQTQYDFVINDIDSNTVFRDLFNFYVNYNSINELSSSNYDDIAYENVNIEYILVFIIIVLCVYVFVDFSGHIKVMMKSVRKNKKIKLSKSDKIKYIDQLTSLKNRAYLNSKIEQWDDADVYPQSIIIIDLNNISYINDNYGREEGDKVITEAANILIQHQLQNSEIIRTDGNEFLIYLVGYEEKQIVSYIRKLNKELKGLSHGFGAASGYSIINDQIKTIDDAVNEATLEMKDNKEDLKY